jgi:hypothetical protein
MASDPIVAEIREIREHLAARFGYDLRAIVKDAQERDAAGDRGVVRLPPHRPPTAAYRVARPCEKPKGKYSALDP